MTDDISEKKDSKPEDIVIETIQNKMHRVKRLKQM